jgi:protein O-mannosyl-transferase
VSHARALLQAPSARGVRRALPLFAFLIAVAIYLPSLGNGFAYDDVAIITLDERVRTFDAGSILTGPYWRDTTSALYRPLTTLSFAVDWRVSDGAPAWFHFTNVLWHGAATVLVLRLLLALGAGVGAAVIGAALFAVHPVHVEAVANTVGRAELIAATFSLAAVLFWIGPARALDRPWRLAALSLLFLGALAAKESAAVLPGLLVVTDIARRRLRPGRAAVWLRRRVRPLAVLGATLALFLLARSAVLGAITPADIDPSLEVLQSPLHRFYTALTAWPQYARLLFFPRTLLADYGPRIMMPAVGPEPAVILGAMLVAVATAGALLAWERGHPRAAAALLWFAVAILPVSNLLVPIGVLVAERTLYLPSVALSLAVLPLSRQLGGVRSRRAVLAAAVAVLIMLPLAMRTVSRIPDWRSTDDIFAALLRDRPDAFRGVWHTARLAAARNDAPAALARYDSAMHLWPYRPRLVREAALYASRQQQPGRAARLTDFGLRRWPDDLVLRRLHAGLLLDYGDVDAARRHIAEGLRWHPRDSLLLRMRDAAVQSDPGI